MNRNRPLRIIKNQLWKNDFSHDMTLKTIGVVGNIPDVFIAGVEKCGTTSLYGYLIQHPKIKKAIQKEPNFFNTFYHKGMQWYRGHFPLSGINIDATPVYYREPKAMKRLKSMIPDKKFIIIMRDPVQRVISAWNMNFAGKWDMRTLEEIIHDETDPELDHGYLAQSRYVNRLDYWFTLFSKEQTHLMRLEDLTQNPTNEFKRLFGFLDLPYHRISISKIHNKGKYRIKTKPSTVDWLYDYFKPYNKSLKEKYGIVY